MTFIHFLVTLNKPIANCRIISILTYAKWTTCLGEKIDANHPFHLHGHAFQVVAMDKHGPNITTEYVRKLHDEGKIPFNFNYPIYKDTISVPDGGYTILHFFAKNAGKTYRKGFVY